MDWVVSRQNVTTAYQHLLRKKDSAPGVDGMTSAELPDYVKTHWSRIRSELLNGTYQPAPIRGVPIHKESGGIRQLGIPTMIDRLIQTALHQALSMMWERDFSPFSYGFRPMRNAHQALAQANEYINAGYQDIIDLDLKSFFDKVNHDKLMHLLRRKITDKRVLALIGRYLRSGIMQGGVVSPRDEGTPQGGPLSPLLSNILLNELDEELSRRGHRFVRYADDCSIFLRSKSAAERVKASITRFLETRLKLEVNEQKTKICRPVKFELLGHGFVPTYKKGERGKYRLCISKKSWARLKRKIKQITRKTLPIPFKERLQRLNRLMYGWVAYFKHATGYQKLKELDSWVRCRLRYCIWKQWKRPRRRYRAFLQLGVEESWARRFAWSRMGGWRIACSPIMGTTVTEERLRQRGYIPFLECYLKAKYADKE